MNVDGEIGEADQKSEPRVEQKQAWVDGTVFRFLILLLAMLFMAIVMAALIYFNRSGTVCGPILRVDSDLENIATQVQFYESMNGVLPSTEQGLAALVEMPKGEPRPGHWKQLIPEMPMDPWGKPYRYRKTNGKNRPTGFEVFSSGKDRLADTEDDVVLKMDASFPTP